MFTKVKRRAKRRGAAVAVPNPEEYLYEPSVPERFAMRQALCVISFRGMHRLLAVFEMLAYTQL